MNPEVPTLRPLIFVNLSIVASSVCAKPQHSREWSAPELKAHDYGKMVMHVTSFRSKSDLPGILATR